MSPSAPPPGLLAPAPPDPTPSRSRIRTITAHAIDGPYPPGYAPQFSTIRFDKVRSVLVEVTTEDGVTGWGECAGARSNLTIATLINATLARLLAGHDATDVSGAWGKVYRDYLQTSGADAAGVIALSGIDMALWDIRGKRGGDRPERDLERFAAVRVALGDGFALMADINTGWSVADLRHASPALDALGLVWLEEPFPPYERAAYRATRGLVRTAIAAGENLFTRYDFQELFDDDVVAHAQPDVSKCGGVTEILRIAALASARKIPLCPHSLLTGLNYATSIHLLCAVDNPGWFEADAAPHNPLRHRLCSEPYRLDADGHVRALEAPGIGVELDLDYLRAHSVVPGT